MRTPVYWSVLGFVFLLALGVSRLHLSDLLQDVDALVLLFLIFLAIKRLFMKRMILSTASGAALMATGIFLSGAFHHFPMLNSVLGKPAALALFLLWLWMMTFYIKEFLRKDERERHVDHPIRSFAIGTWIAATSVSGTVLYHRLPELKWVAEGMAVIAGGLWLLFFVLCLKNFTKVIMKRLYGSVHGIVLLSTVSTQSVVIFYSTLFDSIIPRSFIEIFLIIGAVFYGLGLFLIVVRYYTCRPLNLNKHWTNTNCILHGAMSITGLAGILSGTIAPEIAKGIWIWAFVWFVIVEVCEICRAVARVRNLGLVKGIGTYDVSQWARNFTFGMFFLFTANVRLPADGFWSGIQAFIVTYGAWIVLLLFVNELGLFIKGHGKKRPFKVTFHNNRSQSS
ncbi:MAG TPA: hypothetical protein VFT51_15350 [Bacillales bacterium]|nr:hypothetical protein [Bacillales bacterium]